MKQYTLLTVLMISILSVFGQIKYPKIWTYKDRNRYLYTINIVDTLYAGGSSSSLLKPGRIYLDKAIIQIEGLDSMPIKGIICPLDGKDPVDGKQRILTDVELKANPSMGIKITCYGGAILVIWPTYMVLTYPAVKGQIVQYVLNNTTLGK